MIYKEITADHGTPRTTGASNNNASYILTSSRAKDMLTDYTERYGRVPSSSWLHRHFDFERVK